MSKYLSIINKQLELAPAKKMDQNQQAFIQRYLSTSKKVLGIKTADLEKNAEQVIKQQDELGTNELIEIISGLVFAKTFEQHAIGAKIFSSLKPQIRSKISFATLENWITPARGWVEIDTICQSTYTGQEVLARFADWEKTIKKFRTSENISLRRASLVLQVKPNGKYYDKKLRALAFETVEKLKHEKEILITKAVSWLLRALSVLDKQETKNYILENKETLPSIAFRETFKKIETGNKNGRKK